MNKIRNLDTIQRTTTSKTTLYSAMAFTTMENKTEAVIVKLISIANQILLVHCFLMMIFADLFRTEMETDHIFQQGDDDERTLMDRAESMSSLLLLLSFFSMGVLGITGGRRFMDAINQLVHI